MFILCETCIVSVFLGFFIGVSSLRFGSSPFLPSPNVLVLPKRVRCGVEEKRREWKKRLNGSQRTPRNFTEPHGTPYLGYSNLISAFWGVPYGGFLSALSSLFSLSTDTQRFCCFDAHWIWREKARKDVNGKRG